MKINAGHQFIKVWLPALTPCPRGGPAGGKINKKQEVFEVKKIKFVISSCFVVLLFCLSLHADISILPFEKRAQVIDRWLKTRLETVLPEVMRREKIDMWIIICREYNEDPVFSTLVPSSWYSARRNTMLVFYDRGNQGIERLYVARYNVGDLYKGTWYPEHTDQWSCLSRLIADRNPKKIGINTSDTFAFGDGLSASLKEKLVKAIGPKYAGRLCSAEKLAVGWLEQRTPEELEVYHHIVAIAHRIIAEAFSNKVITPGITTTHEVEWWIREKISSLSLTPWFHPDVDFQRPDSPNGSYSNFGIIKRGDLLHCDIGITYLRLNTDTQEHAYVLRAGKKDVPPGLKDALKRGNQLQDIFTGEFKYGRSGNEILLSALTKAKSAGLNAQIYTHPLGFHGHAAGPTIGLWDKQEGVPGQGDYPLYYNTCYAIELNIKAAIPEWQGKVVRIGLEQDALYSKDGILYLNGRQTDFHIVK